MRKIVFCGYVIIPPHELDILIVAIKEHIRLTLAEPGCVEFTLTEDEDNPHKYSFYQEFVDKTAFKFHQQRVRASNLYKVLTRLERHFNIIEQ